MCLCSSVIKRTDKDAVLLLGSCSFKLIGYRQRKFNWYVKELANCILFVWNLKGNELFWNKAMSLINLPNNSLNN